MTSVPASRLVVIRVFPDAFLISNGLFRSGPYFPSNRPIKRGPASARRLRAVRNPLFTFLAFGTPRISLMASGILRQQKSHTPGKLIEFALMSIVPQNCKGPLSALLAIIFLAAQTGALAHAYEHDPGSPQAQVCSACIAGHSLGSACVESNAHMEFRQHNAGVSIKVAPAPDTIHLPLARQRAPPTRL